MTWFFPMGSLLPAQQPSLADQTAAITFSRLNENFLSWDEEPLGERLWLWHRHHMTWNRKIFGGPKQGLQGSWWNYPSVSGFRWMILKCRENMMGGLNRWHRRKKTMRLASKWDHTPPLKKKRENADSRKPKNCDKSGKSSSKPRDTRDQQSTGLPVYQCGNGRMLRECPIQL